MVRKTEKERIKEDRERRIIMLHWKEESGKITEMERKILEMLEETKEREKKEEKEKIERRYERIKEMKEKENRVKKEKEFREKLRNFYKKEYLRVIPEKGKGEGIAVIELEKIIGNSEINCIVECIEKDWNVRKNDAFNILKSKILLKKVIRKEKELTREKVQEYINACEMKKL